MEFVFTTKMETYKKHPHHIDEYIKKTGKD